MMRFHRQGNESARPIVAARSITIVGMGGVVSLVTLMLSLVSGCADRGDSISEAERLPTAQTEEVVFWHFWGGEDGKVVDDVVRRFNSAQDRFRVRAIAMPGNNLQAKLFLAVTGGDPPDIVNQDDPILADWALRGILRPLDELGSPSELERLDKELFPSAKRLSQVDGRYWGLCNGLDIRALYVNRTALQQHDLKPPETLADLDHIAEMLSPAEATGPRDFFGYLPDSRRLWAWGYVFGGQFYDPAHDRPTIDHPRVVQAAEWMAGYAARYGPDNIAAFRQGDQSLPGKTFPLLPVDSNAMIGRYAIVMDGQWRVRDIRRFQQAREAVGRPAPEFSVCPLPPPPGGRDRAGWVNGNFFVFPKGSRCSEGAWEFAKFWIGLNAPATAATTCEQGGWIPVSRDVVETAEFQSFLNREPLFRAFVELAASPNQFPLPPIPGAPQMKRMVEQAGYEVMNDLSREPEVILRETNLRFQQHLERRRRRLAHD